MAKEECKCPEPPAGAPLWMATFSDMVTLLLTFFVLLLSMANFEDAAKVETVLDSVQMALASNGFNMRDLGAHTMDQQRPNEPVLRPDVLSPTEARVRAAMGQHVSPNLVVIVQQEDELRVRLDDQVLFKPGSTTLHPAAYALITDLSDALSDLDVIIQVEGHTDASGDETQNWEISSKRSLAVVEAFRDRGGIPGERLESMAFGQFRPAAGFGAAPAWNRRIELVLKSNDAQAVGTLKAIEDLTP